MNETNEQQPSCPKCEEAKIAARDEFEDRLMAAQEFLRDLMEKIYLEHEEGEHDG